MKFSIVISVKNRPIEKCLESVFWQTNEDYEVIVVDYGSDRQVTVPKTVRSIYYNRDSEWNHSRANNIGIAKATGKYVVVVNTDIILAPDVLDTLELLFGVNDNYQIYWQRFDLNRFGTRLVRNYITEHSWNAIQRYLSADPDAMGKLHPLSAYGDLMAVERGALLTVGGYDERMSKWGYYDIDLAQRLEKMGYPVYWGIGPKILHQWHQESKKNRAATNIMIGKCDHRITRNPIELFDTYRKLEECG